MADDHETPPLSPDNPFDAWLASAPATPPADICPWCSARLDPPDVIACPSCGAHLGGGEVEPIPGLTVVDPEAVRKVRPVKASGGTGILAWLTGDRDLVDAAVAPDPAAAVAAAEATTLGAASRDAVAPPDPRLRREMAGIGSSPPDDAGVGAGAAADTTAVEDVAADPHSGTGVEAEAAPAQDDPAGPGPTG